jgi:hypothetical protein
VSDTPGCAFDPGRLRDPLPVASLRVGVGQRDEEDALSPVRSSDVARAEQPCLAAVPEELEVTDNFVQPARHERRHVFDHDGARSELARDPGELAPESGACAPKPFAAPRERDVLAGKAATKDVGSRKSCRSCESHIGHAPVRIGPVLREHPAAERILFDLPHDRPEPGLFEAELEAADAGKERAEGPARRPHASIRSTYAPGSAF